jgi:hypothetical protein
MHKNNGVTRIGLVNPMDGSIIQLIRTVEGQLNAVDTINGAFIKSHFPKVNMLNGL